ncbi:MAG: DUF4924 family protein [Muribaculaceae bacterium]|nr:DUF4924 family protein [Muribaculaceae bacterium]
MFIASSRRKDNIAEYLLYMWQIEDIIRANDLDIDKIRKTVIDPQTQLDDNQKHQLEEWYESLIDMMRREEVAKSGHLQLNKNVLVQLVDLHSALLKDPRFPEYTKRFYEALPYIVELRGKSGEDRKGEIETCFNALYGMLMLRLQKREVSRNTMDAIDKISAFVALLSHYFKLDEDDRLFNKDDEQQ